MRTSRSWLLALAASALLAGAGLLPLGPLEVFELETLDLRFRLREGWAPGPAESHVTTVALDDQSWIASGRGRSAYRDYAAAIETLAARGAVVGLALHLTPVDTTSIALAQDYRAFAAAIADARPVLGTDPDEDSWRGLNPVATLAPMALERDDDGVVRRVPLVERTAGGFTPSFTLQMTCATLGVDPGTIRVEWGRWIDLGGQMRVPIDDQGRMLVNYRRTATGDVPLVALAHGGGAPLRSRPAVVGVTARSLARFHATPLAPQTADVHVHAAALETILSGRFLQPAPRVLQFFINWAFLFTGALWMMRLPPWRGVLVGIGMMAAYFAFEKAAFLLRSTWLDVVGPLSAMQAATLCFPLYSYRQRAHALLREMARLRHLDDVILSTTTSGLLVADAGGRVQRANARAAQLLGREEEALRGCPLGEIFAASPVALAAIDEVRRTQAAGPDSDSCMLPVHVAARLESGDDGDNDRILDLSVAALDAEDGDTPGNAGHRYLITFTDITERLHIAQEDERRARLAAIGEIAARLGHEIRNSLGGLRLYVENVREEIDPKSAAGRAIDSMVDEIESLYRKIDELREYARDPILDVSECDVQQLVDEALAFAGQKLRDKQVQVRIQSEPHLPLLHADRRQIRDAFQNLINNAIEAAPEGGHLRIVVERSTNGIAPVGHYLIHFEDDGPGIPAEIGDQVFSLFFTTKADAGTGLGLPIVRKIIESHGGKVTFKSEPGAGTRFTVALPPGRMRGDVT